VSFIRPRKPQLTSARMSVAVPVSLFSTITDTGQMSPIASDVFTPTANSLKMVLCTTRHSTSVTPPSIDLVDSLGQTWTLAFDDTATAAGNTAPGLRTQIYAHRTSNSPVPMTVTVSTATATSHNGVCGFEIPYGAGDDYSNIDVNKGTAGDATVVLSPAPSAKSMVIGMCNTCGSGAYSSLPAALTTLFSFLGGTAIEIHVGYRTGSTATTDAWVSGNSVTEGLLMEIKIV
jgi:hypothetical protein